MNQMVQRQFSLVPETMEQAFRLAEMMSKSLVPAHLQNKPENCLLVVEQAARWNLSPFAVAQETAVIQGKLMYSGKLTAAVVNALGGLTRRLSFTYTGSGDNRACLVSGTMQGEDMPRTVEVILRDAKTTNRVWQTQPDQQLAYFGARAWARRHTPELMLGVYSPEEFNEDTARSIRHRDAIIGEPMQALPAPTPPHDPDTGEVFEDSAPATPPAPVVADSPAPPPTASEGGAGAVGSTLTVAGGADEDTIFQYEQLMEKAAKRGTVELTSLWRNIPKQYHKDLEEMKDRCKDLAKIADREMKEAAR